MAGPRRSAARPAATIPTTVPSMNALNTNPYRLSPCRSLATSGITVTTASASAATNVIVAARPTVSARRSAAQSPSVIASPSLPHPSPCPRHTPAQPKSSRAREVKAIPAERGSGGAGGTAGRAGKRAGGPGSGDLDGKRRAQRAALRVAGLHGEVRALGPHGDDRLEPRLARRRDRRQRGLGASSQDGPGRHLGRTVPARVDGSATRPVLGRGGRQLSGKAGPVPDVRPVGGVTLGQAAVVAVVEDRQHTGSVQPGVVLPVELAAWPHREV